ncbi:hypothetical protein BGZ89_010574 [Linnemannia elongata]|nr:hypothetical protein BGZ89_010574 [Linnemannia elongata]
MNTLTPSRARTQQRVTNDLHNNTNDYSSPARGKATTTPPLYTTVDNLLLPGVIGATVEGPKTPIRSPNAKRVLDFFPHANTNSSSNKNRMSFSSSPFAAPQSRRANGNYIDTEVALERPSSLGFGQGTPRNNGHIPQTPQGKQYRKAFRPHDTPIAGSKRPQNSDSIDILRNGGSNGRKSGGLTSYLYRPSPFVDDQVDDLTSPVSELGHNNDDFAEDDDNDGHQPRSANFRSRQETDRTLNDQFEHTEDHQLYSKERHQFDNVEDERDDVPRDELEHDVYEDDDEGLDIGEQEDEIYPHERLRGNGYEDTALDDQGEESLDEHEIAELKREQEQLGFIKRWAHLLRKQRDEFGWGNSKQQDGYPSEGSDVDSDSSFTSARVRRESFQRKKTPVASRLSKVVAAPASASKPSTPEPRSPTPQSGLPRSSQPTSPRSHPTPSRSQAISPRSPSKSPFNIPSMRQFDSGIGLDGSQESHDEAEHLEELLEEEAEEEEDEDADVFRHTGAEEEEEDLIVPDVYRPLERRITPSPRPSSRASAFKEEEEEDERPYITERYDHHSDTSDYESDTEHRSRYGVNLRTKHPIEPRYSWHYETAHSPLHQSTEASTSARVYPWHVVGYAVEGHLDTLQHNYLSLTTALEYYAWTVLSWISFILLWPWSQRHAVWKTGESWARAGVASGLLRPGTLFGVALLGLAVWASHKFGYEGVSGVKDGRACNNETIVPSPSRGPGLKEIVSSTWDRISWPSTPERDGRPYVSNPRKWFDWVPSIPSVEKWIPSRKTSKPSPSPSSTIQIPTEQIQSLEELESRIEWIQKVLVDLGHADDRLDKELQSKLDDMSVWVSGVEHKLKGVEHNVNKVSSEVESLKKYVSDGQWIEQRVLELVRDEIPKHLVVARDPRTGKLSIPSDFWDHARELFMTSNQVQQSIKDQVALLDQDSDDQQEDASSSSRWSWGSSRGKKKSGKAIGWDDFLLENEKAMGSFVEGRMSKVSRTVFLSLLRTEANSIWQSLERNVVALLEKQGKLEGKAAPVRGGYDSSNSAHGNNNHPGRALTDIERDLISGLIDKALEKYSADALAKPDYALHSAGGRIIPRLTSPNYFHYVDPTLLGRLGARFFVPLPRREKPAEKAIEPDMHAGECWAMDGQEGQLAVRLARKIVITEVTIEHADPSVVLDLGSAAREIEIWGLRGRDDAAPVTSQSSRPHVEPSSTASADKQEQENKQEVKAGDRWREGAPWPGSTLLTTIEFNANTTIASNIDGDAPEKPKSRQTFSIPLSKQIVPSVGAVFRIKSNWGHPKMTCIYRVRVHGYEITDTPEQQ